MYLPSAGLPTLRAILPRMDAHFWSTARDGMQLPYHSTTCRLVCLSRTAFQRSSHLTRAQVGRWEDVGGLTDVKVAILNAFELSYSLS